MITFNLKNLYSSKSKIHSIKKKYFFNNIKRTTLLWNLFFFLYIKIFPTMQIIKIFKLALKIIFEDFMNLDAVIYTFLTMYN